MELYFSENGVREIADNVTSAADAFRRTRDSLDSSMEQLKNAAFKGIVGDEALANYENVVRGMIEKMIARAEEYAKDVNETIDMMVDAGLASP